MSERNQRRGVLLRPFDAIASAVVPVVADAVDPDDLIDRIDVNALIDRIDVNALVARIDVDTLLDRLDLDTVLDRIDLDRLIARIDVDSIIDRVDVDRIVARVDLDAIVDQVDVDRVVARVDLDAAVARVDLDAAAERIDVDRIVARVDVDAVAASLDIDAIVAQSTKGVMGRFTDLLRRQVVGVDEIAMRTTNRLLRRDYDSLPAGPPLDGGHEAIDCGGATMSGRYAGPVSRIGALGLDVFLISSTFTLLLAGVAYLVDALFGASIEPNGAWFAPVLLVLYSFTYFWLSQSLTGRTISQALVGIKVIRSDGQPLGPGAAAIRTIVLPFSFLLFGAGALMALVDRRRRALHDVAAKSAVVYDWGDRPAALPAPLTRFLERRTPPVGAARR